MSQSVRAASPRKGGRPGSPRKMSQSARAASPRKGVQPQKGSSPRKVQPQHRPAVPMAQPKSTSTWSWNWLTTGKIILIIIGLIVVYVILKAILGPIFSALSGPFGLMNAVTGALSDMINSCSKSGWFSTSCGVGIFAAVAGGLAIITRLGAALLTRYDAKSLVAQAANASGKSPTDLAVEVGKELRDRLPEIDAKLAESNLADKPGAVKMARSLVVAKSIQKIGLEGLKDQQHTPDSFKEAKDRINKTYQTAVEEADRSAEENDKLDEGERDIVKESFME